MPTISRRAFVGESASCAAHLALALLAAPTAWRRGWLRQSAGRVVAREPFGTLSELADGVWALISDPLGGDRTTLANGGFVAGTDGVLAVEGFYQPAGAAWLAGKARELTGRWPTHVVLTHYHADHANGVAGYGADGAMPAVHATGVTRDDVLSRNHPPDDARTAALAAAEIFPDTAPTTLDLGGRHVRIVPRRGHTTSDMSVELDEPGVVFCGDLVWNGMVPNYVDTIPSALATAVRALRRPDATLYVPGHGPLAREPDLDRYVGLIDAIEAGARAGHAEGRSATEAAAEFRPAASLGEWTAFSPTYFERAFLAWYRELDG